MRLVKILLLASMIAVPLVLVSGASALDLCEEPHCQPPDAEQNTFFEWEFEAEEGCVPYTFKHVNGTLPPGLAVTPDGELEGTPTHAGTFDFWVSLNDNGGPNNPACLIKGLESQAHFFMTILPDLAVITQSLPVATPGQPYSFQLQFSNPEPGWRVIWDITQGTLPTGLTLSENGVISGTATAADAKTFTVRAREPFRRFGERQVTLTVATALRGSAPVRQGEVGLRYSGAIRASGGLPPFTFALASGTLPRGLGLNPATGRISGIPRVPGSAAVAFTVTDAGGQRVEVRARLRIAARLAISTARLPAAAIGASYGAELETRGGVAPRRWRIASGAFPLGLRLDRVTGRLSGTPTTAGVYTFTVEARDRLGARSRKTFRLTVSG